ncbi:hypothetical protein BK708_37610 [Bacillus thuringiensis serovar yunnanensis]|nr:hypothetical protein BK708_37610 [Bacillus thuringiensis serovar yunnanensis]
MSERMPPLSNKQFTNELDVDELLVILRISYEVVALIRIEEHNIKYLMNKEWFLYLTISILPGQPNIFPLTKVIFGSGAKNAILV